MFSNLQNLILLLLMVTVFITQLFCIVDISMRPPRAFTSEGKRTKTFWLVVLIVAAIFGFLALPYPLGAGNFLFIGLISSVPAIVYLVDVRVAIARHGRGGRGPRGGGSGGRGTRGGW